MSVIDNDYIVLYYYSSLEACTPRNEPPDGGDTHSPFDFVSDTAGAKNLVRMDGLFRRDIRLSLFFEKKVEDRCPVAKDNSGRLATGITLGSGMHGFRHQPHAQRRADTADSIEARLCISPQRLVKRFAR